MRSIKSLTIWPLYYISGKTYFFSFYFLFFTHKAFMQYNINKKKIYGLHFWNILSLMMFHTELYNLNVVGKVSKPRGPTLFLIQCNSLKCKWCCQGHSLFSECHSFNLYAYGWVSFQCWQDQPRQTFLWQGAVEQIQLCFWYAQADEQILPGSLSKQTFFFIRP